MGNNLLDDSLMNSNYAIKRLISGTLMKLIDNWKILCKYRRIIRITKTIIRCKFANSRRWLNLVRIQFPIIEIDISRLNLRNCPTIHLYENYTSRKSPTCPDFITILIENQISHRFIATDCCEYFSLVCEIVLSSIGQMMNNSSYGQEFFFIDKNNISLDSIHIVIDRMNFLDYFLNMRRS